MLSEVIDKYGDFDFKKLWVFCENCNLLNYKKTFLSKLYVCEECGYHIKINSSDRIQITIDKNTWNPLNQDLFSLDPLDFDDDTVNDSIYDDDTIDDNKTIKDETIYDNIINDYTIYDNNNTINDDDTIDEIYNIFKSQNFFDKNFVDCIDLRYLAELDEDLPFTLEELEEDLPFTKEELKGYLLLYQDELQEYLPFIKEKLKLDLPLLKEELEKYLSKEQEKLKLDLPLFKEELEKYLSKEQEKLKLDLPLLKEELEKYLSKEQEKLKLDVSFLDQIYKLIEIKKKKRKEKKLKELYISFEEEIVRLIENQKKSIENELKIEKESNLNFYEILNDTIDKLLKEEEEKDNFKKAHYNNITDEIKKDIKLRSSFYKRISKEIQEKEIQEYEDKEKNKLKSAKPKKSNIHNIFNENFDEIEKNKSYIHRLNFYQEQTKLPEAVQTGIGKINDIKVALGVMDSEFLGGSMGSAVGEKLTCLIEYATKKNLPIIIFCASGGARIQEGVFSLIQMSKISAALHYYKSKKNSLYISVLTSPTAGGVIASFGMLGDIIISEPNTTIAFAGQRVIEQILKKEVPKGFQKAEYLFKQGAFDLILPRQLLKTIVTELLKLHGFYPCS
uniref:Acetyl-coenzyme A carboxylase carboxyl transferase subunit beta n=1 Tax=Prosopanche americana TaxID=29816 RepID=A0A6H0DU55_PROAM|nr:acetyl-CoA carboxylase beta subunit [Prosopanche americana]